MLVSEVNMPPVVCIVGRSNSGKTTLVEKLLVELTSRGYRIATVKHAQDMELDKPGTDSWRHLAAGSEVMVLATQDRVALMKNPKTPPTIDEMVRLIGEGYDLVLVEGFKGESAPKIEVQRNATGPLLQDLQGLIALVSDDQAEAGVRRFSWRDINGLADLIADGFIKPNPVHLSVYADGKPLVLNSFPQEFVRNVMLAMAGSLKGGEEAKSLEFRLRRG
jgi:molybdopterin-guanine dinucleotide biosynthesis protein MobB